MNKPSYTDIGNITPEFQSMIKLPDENGAKLNYLFVMPIRAVDNNSAYRFHSAFANVCSALKVSGRNVFTLNLNYKKEPEKWLKHLIFVNQIDVVLTSAIDGFYCDAESIKTITDFAKGIKPSIITVVSGGFITGDPVSAMEALETADYGMIGECEITVNALAYALENGLDPTELDGIICKRNGVWLVRKNWPIIYNLDILPFPDYSGFEYGLMFEKSVGRSSLESYKSIETSFVMSIITSRSCPGSCTFCFNAGSGKYRKMSADRIFKEIDWLLSRYPIELLELLDEIPFVNRESLLEFCKRIKPYNLQWKLEMRVDQVTEEVLKVIYESGGRIIFLGIESLNNKILKSMRKNITVEQIESVLELCRNIGVEPMGNLIFGDPEETMETFWCTMNWWRKNRKLKFRTYMIKAYPGTKIYNDACAKGIIKDPVQFIKDGCPPVNLTKMTDDEYNVLPILIDVVRRKRVLKEGVVNPLGGNTVNVSGICPCCKMPISFPRYEYVFNNTPFACPICGRPIIVNPIEFCDYEKMNNNALNILKGQNAAVWAVNANNFYWLLQAMPALKADNVLFINQYEIVIPHNGKTVKSFEGKPVEVPDILADSDIETVLVPNNPKAFEEIKAQCKARFPNVKKIVHITELM